MERVRIWLSIAGFGLLSACTGPNYTKAGMSPEGVAAVASYHAAAHATSRTADTPEESVSPSQTNKLIALTFDDGPRPYVLFGATGVHPAPGLVDILDQNGAKATFFVVGWRLTPKTWGEPKHEENIGVTCIDAAERLVRRGYELEDHTYSHLELRSAEKRNGEQWVMQDVERGAQAIKAITGTEPRYVRPPDWIIPDDARRNLEQLGYRVLSISAENPMTLRDVNSLDYLCAGKNPSGCPKPSLVDAVLKQVEQREKKGVYQHILAFHELSTTAAAMPRLITDLQARGYRFVTLTEYMKLMRTKSGERLKQQAAVTRQLIRAR